MAGTENPKAESGRTFNTLYIYFDATDFIETIDRTKSMMSSSLIMKSWTTQTISLFLQYKFLPEFDLLNFPIHIQYADACVKIVTESADKKTEMATLPLLCPQDQQC